MDLSNYGRCPFCNERDFLGMHKCDPEWEVRHEDYEEWDLIRAKDAEKAACKFMEQYDQDGYGITREATVYVRLDGITRKFKVMGEMVPEYWTEEGECLECDEAEA